MIAGTIRVVGIPVRLRGHVVERYIERVKPALDQAGALEDLQHIAECASFGPPPEWTHERIDGPSLGQSFERWLLLGDDIAFALEPSRDGGYLAITCITRTGISDLTRQNRARRRAGGGRKIGPVARWNRERRGAWRSELLEELAP